MSQAQNDHTARLSNEDSKLEYKENVWFCPKSILYLYPDNFLYPAFP